MLGSDLKETERDMVGSVLVVDDVRVNRLILERTLSRLGCMVTAVDNGPDAVRLARETPPDLALVDVLMPGMDGYEVCRQLKADSRTRDTPVIMVTALNEMEDLETGFGAGAMDYIGRPFNSRELVARVRNALQLKHQGDRLRRFQARISRELELAGVLQQTMLSMPPFLTPELQVSTAYRPSLQVSGDLFDRMFLPDGRGCFYIADVAGHGVAAAMLSSLLKAIFTDVLQSAPAGVHPSVLCNDVDARFRRSVSVRSAYATAFIGIYDPVSHLLHAMSCGHPSPIVVAPNGDYSLPFEVGGSMPIGFGLQGRNPFELRDEVALKMEPGATLFLYTDGLIEAHIGDGGEECGLDHLAETVQRMLYPCRTPGICDRVMDALLEEGYRLEVDDCSAMMLQAVNPASVIYDRQLSVQLSVIRSAGAHIEALLIKRGWSEMSAGAVQLVFFEYCNNMVEHGGCGKDDVLDVQMHYSDAGCVLIIRDTGPEWTYPKSITDVVMPGVYCEKGRGLAMICRLTPHACFYRDEHWNVALLPVFRYTSKHFNSEGVNNVGEAHDE